MHKPTDKTARTANKHTLCKDFYRSEDIMACKKVADDNNLEVWQSMVVDISNSSVILDILSENNIRPRTDDGKLDHSTISVPTSRNNELALGLRYSKRDGTYAEDIFLFEKNKDIKPYYKGQIEKILSEYKGTHKKQNGFY